MKVCGMMLVFAAILGSMRFDTMIFGCLQARKNIACKYPVVATGKLQQCTDCLSVRYLTVLVHK